MKAMLCSACGSTTVLCTRTTKSCYMTGFCKTARPAHDPTQLTEFITTRTDTMDMVGTANMIPSGTTRELRPGVTLWTNF